MRWLSLWHRFTAFLGQHSPFSSLRRRVRRCCLTAGCGLGVVLLVLVLLILLLVLAVDRAFGQAPAGDGVMLLIDNSNSMYDLGGVGSDPDLLRIEAARLFTAYLGVDADEADHRLGVIFFGGEAELVVPLTPLRDDIRRAEIADLIAEPERMRWTDPNRALELAYQALFDDPALAAHRPVVILLTDGKPQWSSRPTEEEIAAYVARTRELAARFHERGAAIFVILLANEATEADAEIARRYRPLWQEITDATPPGRFYQIHSADDLVSVYHDIVVALSGAQTEDPVVEAQVAELLRRPVTLEAGLARVTFVVYKSEPALTVTLLRPDGRRVGPTDPGVRRAGEGRHEVWAIAEPEPGTWTVLISGHGRVTVWKDYWLAPITPTPLPSPTVTPMSTPTPAPHLAVIGLPEAVWVGQTITLTARLRNVAGGATIVAHIQAPDGSRQTVALVDDGRLADDHADDGLYAAHFAPWTPGVHLMRLEARQAVTRLVAWEGRIEAVTEPILSLTAPREGTAHRVGRPIAVAARWHPEEVTTSHAWAEVKGPTAVTVTLSAEGAELSGRVAGLMTPGIYTLTVGAEGQVEPGLPVAAESVTAIRVRASTPWWAWGLGAVTMAGLGGICGWLLRWRTRPRVEGVLERLDGPAGERGIDLDGLARPVVRLGPSAAGDVPLNGEAAALIRPRPTGEGALRLRSGPALEMVLTVTAGEAAVNGHPLLGEHVLRDGDLLTLGGSRFRYHNLRQHSNWQ